MKKTILFAFLSLGFARIASSQIILNGNMGTASNPCGAMFYDSGGSGGVYQNNENDVITLCAPAGQYLNINFSAFQVESGFDNLYVYNGTSTTSPLIGSYTGANSPGSITSTQGGCITIKFTSDGSVTYAGWTASISCSSTLPPPPPPPAQSGTTCASAQPFCTGSGVTFQAGVNNGSAPAGPNYGCLFSQPNPA
ncbi:MAG: CUB domain-containing protein, partial [Bacteroidia bacterium]